MPRQGVGRAVRFLRQRSGWRQADLGERAGTSRQTVSRIERGRLDAVSVAVLRSVVQALGAGLTIDVAWQGERLERLMDAEHARYQERSVSRLRASGWTAEVEVSFNWYGDRGRYDALAYHPPTGTLLVVEVKTRLVDVQDTLGRLDVKVRLAPRVASHAGGRLHAGSFHALSWLRAAPRADSWRSMPSSSPVSTSVAGERSAGWPLPARRRRVASSCSSGCQIHTGRYLGGAFVPGLHQIHEVRESGPASSPGARRG